MKFFITDFFSKCDQIRRKLRIWSHLLKKSVMENFIFCTVIGSRLKTITEYFFKQFEMTPLKLEEISEAISPEERLCVTLRYVVTGDAHVTIGACSYGMYSLIKDL